MELKNSENYKPPTDKEMLLMAYGALKVNATKQPSSDYHSPGGAQILKILEEYLFPKPILICEAPTNPKEQ